MEENERKGRFGISGSAYSKSGVKNRSPPLPLGQAQDLNSASSKDTEDEDDGEGTTTPPRARTMHPPRRELRRGRRLRHQHLLPPPREPLHLHQLRHLLPQPLHLHLARHILP